MRFVQLGFVVFIWSATTICAAAQQELCTALLRNGVFDEETIKDDESLAQYFRSRFCSQTSDSRSTSADATIILPQLPKPVGFGWESSSSSQSNICDEKTVSSDARKAFSRWARTASKPLIDGFNQCMNNNAEGFAVSVRKTAIGRFQIWAKLSVRDSNTPPVTLKIDFQPKEAVSGCVGHSVDDLRRGNSIRNWATFQAGCTLTHPAEGVDIVVNATRAAVVPVVTVLPDRPNSYVLDSNNKSRADGVNNGGIPGQGYAPAGDGLMDRYDGHVLVPPTGSRRSVSWKIENVVQGRYQVYTTYAAATPRPLNLFVDGRSQFAVAQSALSPHSQGWNSAYRQTVTEQAVELSGPAHEIRLDAVSDGGSWPHFKELRLVYIGR